MLPELGLSGQKKLKGSKVAVIGLGGLGSASTLYLTLAGVGHLRLVDQDTVELHNLHRQVLYTLDDLRFPKVEAAAKRIGNLNPDVEVEPVPENVRESNVDEIVEGMDCVVDGLDNMRTRYLINRACVKMRVPYVFAAAIGIEGYLSVFDSPATPCLECVFPHLDDRYLMTCETRGILGTTPGIIGTMQAMETIKLLAGIGTTLKNKLMIFDFSDMYFTQIDITKNPKCRVCGKPAVREPIEKAEQLVWLCGRNTVNVNPKRPLKLSLDNAHDTLKRRFKILLKSPFVVVFKYQNAEVSLFSGGRALIKKVKDEETAMKIYRDLTKILETEVD